MKPDQVQPWPRHQRHQPLITSPLVALVEATRRAGISPLRFAGGHGSTAEYAPLAGMAKTE